MSCTVAAWIPFAYKHLEDRANFPTKRMPCCCAVAFRTPKWVSARGSWKWSRSLPVSVCFLIQTCHLGKVPLKSSYHSRLVHTSCPSGINTPPRARLMGGKRVDSSAHSTLVPPETQDVFTPALVSATLFLESISFEFITTGEKQHWAAERKQTHKTREAGDLRTSPMLYSYQRSVLRILWPHEYTSTLFTRKR